MVTDMTATVGIDIGPERCFVARVEDQTGRPQVKALARFDRQLLRSHQLLANCRHVFSISDDLALVKRLPVSPVEGYETEDLARFEMAQCMIEPEDAFHFQVAGGDDSGVVLGYSVHRDHCEQLRDLVSVDDGPQTSADFAPRAVALARGYRTYCRPHGGELEILMDLGRTVASIAIIHRGDLADTAFLRMEGFDLGCDPDRGRLSQELRTIVNFRLASLARDGISIPPSIVLVSGENSRQEVYDVMRCVFTCPVETPQMSAAFFPNQIDLNRLPLELYIVALGLTA